MAKLMGQWPSFKSPGLLTRLTTRINEAARLQVEAAAGLPFGRVEPVIQSQPDSVTLLRGPVLGFSMKADGCLLGPGRVVVFSLLHWRGAIALNDQGSWVGQAGRLDLGRPDRRAALFANRLQFSGLAGALDVEPVVITTGGPVSYAGPTEALLIPLEDLDGYLETAFQPEGPYAPLDLINTLLGR
jgi:hypothetical protein